VHRDVKPANILLDANLHARLADTGFAKATRQHADERLTLSVGQGACYTPGYADPIIINGGECASLPEITRDHHQRRSVRASRPRDPLSAAAATLPPHSRRRTAAATSPASTSPAAHLSVPPSDSQAHPGPVLCAPRPRRVRDTSRAGTPP